jgi:cyclomaltodextrinase
MTERLESSSRPDWVPDAVFYQIFPERYRNGDPANDPPGVGPWDAAPTRENFLGGDLAGIRESLSYLVDLGVTGLYMTPFFEAKTNHRYDCSDYLKIDPAMGDEQLLRELVADAHTGGIRVLLDGVFNHCGDGFWAFRDLIEKGEDSPYRDWFFQRSFPIEQDPPNYKTCGGAAFLPKLNTENSEVRDYLLKVAAYWIDAAGIDGWRLDVPWKADRDFWQAFQQVVKMRSPDAYLAGEIWRDGRAWQDVFDGVMNYRYRNCLLDYCVFDHMDAEDFQFETDALFAEPYAEWQLNLLGSHDTPRLLTLCQGDARRAMLALFGLFVAPGAPMLYYGDEIGMMGENDPGCRAGMIWDRSQWNQDILAHCRQMIALRHRLPALRRGTWEPLLTFNGVLAVRRRHAGGDVVFVMNPRNAQTDFDIPIPCGDGSWIEELAGSRHSVVDGVLTIGEIPACSAKLFTQEQRR